jgi:hypothetical protein
VGGVGRPAACLLGVAAACLFIASSAWRLTAQGAYYDELHQAAPAFAYVGRPPEMFARVVVGGVPVLNMSYSGAIKTALYGAVLAATGRPFSLADWRIVGIALVAAGLLAFTVLARRGLSTGALVACLLLVSTDVTLILASRHDWGPSALGMLLRLTFLGLWVAGSGRLAPSPASTAILGLVVGLAVFEKLSSVLLVLPLALACLADPRRRARAHWLAGAAGLLAGALPLVAANALTLVEQGAAVSLSEADRPGARTLRGLARHGLEYLALAHGRYVRAFILGDVARRPLAAVEAAACAATLAMAVLAAGRLARRDPALRAGLIAAAGYAAVGVGLYLLPRPAWKSGLGPHHLLLGTPFQYVAVALALTGLERLRGDRWARWAGRCLWLGLVIWLASRAPGMVSLERSLGRGAASVRWHPSLTRLGEFAGRRADRAIFVATDWGVATQMYCFANGRPGVVHEPFWPGGRALASILQRAGSRAVYLVELVPPSGVTRETGRITASMATAPGWVEVPPENEVVGLRAVRVRKFVRADSAGAPGPADVRSRPPRPGRTSAGAPRGAARGSNARGPPRRRPGRTPPRTACTPRGPAGSPPRRPPPGAGPRTARCSGGSRRCASRRTA